MAHLIDKDALVAEIEKRKKQNEEWKNSCKGIDSLTASMVIQEDINILSFLDTLEVKEVDLDSDIRTYLTNHFNIYEDGVLQSKESKLPLSTYDIIKVADNFFELGLKAQKGEEV